MANRDNVALKRRILDCVREIPSGRVATYGDIAKLAAAANYARFVGYTLKTNIAADVPWHRVVRADGSLAGTRPEVQRQKLLDEAVDTVDYRVDLKRYRWLEL